MEFNFDKKDGIICFVTEDSDNSVSSVQFLFLRLRSSDSIYSMIMDYLSSVNKVLIISGQCCRVWSDAYNKQHRVWCQGFFRRQANKLSANLSFELLPSFTLVSCFFFALWSTALVSNLPVGDQRNTTFAEVETHKAIRKTIVKMEQLEL